jgi:hypothetical protein
MADDRASGVPGYELAAAPQVALLARPPIGPSASGGHPMSLTVLTALTALLLLVLIFELLRRRQLREKYAVLWMVVGLAVLPLGFFPRLLDSLARAVGVVSGVSLVLFMGIVFLLVVCIHLSWEASRLEGETRTLAEEVALIRAQLAERDQSAEREPVE